MSYDSQASSRYGATPFELFWFTMAPTFPAGLPAHSWYLTSGDESRTYLTHTYDPCQISVPEGITHDNELQSGAVDVELPSDHPVAQLFLRGKPIAPVFLTIFGGHDGDSEVVVRFSGEIKNSKRGGGKTTLTAMPDHQAVRKDVPSVNYQRPCCNVVYDRRCGIAIGAESPMRMSWTGTIAAVAGRTITIGPGEFVDYWYNNHWTGSGPNQVEPTCSRGFVVLPSGRGITIDDHQGWGKGLILTHGDDELAVGLEITIHRGCRGTLADCKQINNDVNFFGFEAVPGNPFVGGLF